MTEPTDQALENEAAAWRLLAMERQQEIRTLRRLVVELTVAYYAVAQRRQS